MKKILGIYCCICLFSFKSTLYSQIYEEKSSSLGVDIEGFEGYLGGGVSFVDLNNDGWDDLSFCTKQGLLPRFFLNNQDRFEEVIFIGIDAVCESKALLWVDFDNDDDLDLFISCYQDQNQLYLNNGDLTFTNNTAASNIPDVSYESFGLTAGDVNNDGLLDVYELTRSVIGPNQFYLNLDSGILKEETELAGLDNGLRLDFCGAFLDYNNDGMQDLYVSSDYRDPNTMYKNVSNSLPMVDVSSDTNGDIAISAMNVGVGDFDNDLDQDIYVTNIPQGNELMINESDTFSLADQSFGLGFFRTGWAANWLDYDNDGWLDLYVSAMQNEYSSPNALYHNEEGVTFTEPFRNDGGIQGIDTASSFSNAIGDYNNDGLLDIALYNAFPYKASFFENQHVGNNYLKLSLEGNDSNRNGVGTKIYTHFEGKTIMRYVHAGEGYLNQNSFHQHFGIGTATVLDSIELFWLSGIRDVYHNIDANQFLHVVEGSSSIISELCPVTTLQQDQITTDTSFVMAKSVIIKSQVTANIELQAGNMIVFGEGFELGPNSELEVIINTCN